MPDERPGQLRNGFNILARDLDRAVVVAGFAELHLLLIEQARELSYADAKRAKEESPRPFRINLSALARDTGKARKWLSVRFRELVQYGVFIPLDEGGYLINKDFRMWVDDDGQPRLTQSQIRWCRSNRFPVATLPQLKWVACGNPATPPVADLPHPPVATLPQGTHLTNGPPLDPPCESDAPAGGTGTGAPARGIETQFESKRTPLTPPQGGARSRRESRSEYKERKRNEMRATLEAMFGTKANPKDSPHA